MIRFQRSYGYVCNKYCRQVTCYTTLELARQRVPILAPNLQVVLKSAMDMKGNNADWAFAYDEFESQCEKLTEVGIQSLVFNMIVQTSGCNLAR